MLCLHLITCQGGPPTCPSLPGYLGLCNHHKAGHERCCCFFCCRAICLDLLDKADVLEYYDSSVRSVQAE